MFFFFSRLFHFVCKDIQHTQNDHQLIKQSFARNIMCIHKKRKQKSKKRQIVATFFIYLNIPRYTYFLSFCFFYIIIVVLFICFFFLLSLLSQAIFLGRNLFLCAYRPLHNIFQFHFLSVCLSYYTIQQNFSCLLTICVINT